MQYLQNEVRILELAVWERLGSKYYPMGGVASLLQALLTSTTDASHASIKAFVWYRRLRFPGPIQLRSEVGYHNVIRSVKNTAVLQVGRCLPG